MHDTTNAEAPPTADPRARNLARIALTGFSVFAVLVIGQGLLRDDRSAVRDVVSSYAVGHLGWVQTIAFISIGVGELALGVAIWLAAGGRPGLLVVGVFVAVGCLVDWTSAVFEIDLDAAPSTVHGEIHDMAGLIGFLSVLTVMVIMWRVGRRTPQWHAAARWSGVAAALMAVGFLVVGAGDSGGWGGLAQRYVIAVFVAWYAVMAREVLQVTKLPHAKL